MDLIGFTEGNKEYLIRYVRPIFYEDGKFYEQSPLKGILASFITSTDDEKKIEKEIEAYANKKHSYISSVIDYSKATNYVEKNNLNFISLDSIPQHIIKETDNFMGAVMIGDKFVIAGDNKFIYENCSSLLHYNSELIDGELKNIIHILKSLFLGDECLEFINDAKADGRNIFYSRPYQKTREYLKEQAVYCHKINKIPE